MSGGSRWVGTLLRLLPSAFRARHGEEIERTFAEMRADLGDAPGLVALLRLYVGVTADVLRQIPWALRGSGAGGSTERPPLLRGASATSERPTLLRDVGVPGWLDLLAADLRFALRHFRRSWGTTATTLGILAFGMSVSVLLFSFVHSYATQPPPGIPRAPDLVRIRGIQVVDGEPSVRTFSAEEFEGFLRLGDNGPFTAVAGWMQATVGIDVPGHGAEEAPTGVASFVSERYFEVMGVRPVLGPGLAGVGGDAEVVIGHGVWTDLFGRDPGVVGRTIDLNGVPTTVVGVAPEKFGGVGSVTRFKVWLPEARRAAVLPMSSAAGLPYRAVARLRSGMSLEAASAAVHSVTQAVARESSGAVANSATADVIDADVVPLLSGNGDPSFDRDVRRLALAMGALGVIVLVITSTNVSALLLSLAMARRHEIVVRLSLGAARSRILRQLLRESALLACVAGVIGLAVVSMLPRLVRRLPEFPFELEVSWPAAIFTLATALGTALLFGLVPALHATRLPAAAALRDAGASPSGTRLRAQRALVVAQVAFTQPLLVVLVTALLLLMGEFRPEEPGPIATQVARITLAPGADVARLRAALEATPGVAATALAPSPIQIGAYQLTGRETTGARADDRVRLDGLTAAPGLFELMEIPVIRGRPFSDEDLASALTGGAAAALGAHTGTVPVIIGSDLAKRLWPAGEPIGERLVAAGEGEADVRPAGLVVVGVYEVPAGRPPRSDTRFSVYLPGTPAAGSALFVRTHGDAAALLSPSVASHNASRRARPPPPRRSPPRRRPICASSTESRPRCSSRAGSRCCSRPSASTP